MKVKEIEAMRTCLNALDALTPAERTRVIEWLSGRVLSDLRKGEDAAEAVSYFLRTAAA